MTARSVGGYDVVRELGRGGMAIVYLARQRELARDVALKELSALHDPGSDSVRRFLRESRLVGSMSHPCIVTVHDLLEADGTPYIAMEYLERGSLRPWVGKLSQTQTVGVLRDVLSGLAHAGRRGIVHRDLKPENLLVTDDGRVKIADFGIAKALGQSAETNLTRTGTTMGTPAYMAPEQAMGTDVGPATDLYSLGVIAYELLSGRVPFESTGTPMAVLLRHVQEPVPPLLSRAPHIDAELAGWVEALLAKDPSDRPPTADAARERLEEIAFTRFGPRWERDAAIVETEQLPVAVPEAHAPTIARSAPAPALPTRSPPASRRRPSVRLRAVVPAVAAAASALVLLLVIGGGNGHKAAPTSTTIRVGAQPDGILVSNGRVYVCLDSTGELVRLAPRASVKVGDQPDSIAFGAGRLWVTATGSNTVTTVDPTTMRIVPPGSVYVDDSPEGVSIGFGSVWIAGRGGDTVDRLDQTMTSPNADYLASYHGVSSPVAIAIGPRAVWFTTRGGVVRANPADNSQSDEILVGDNVRGVAVNGNSVYAVSAAGNRIVRIDATGMRVIDKRTLGGSPSALTAGAGALWVTLRDTDQLLRIDPATLAVTNSYRTGREPLNVAVGAGAVWTSNYGGGTVTRIPIS